MSNINTVTFTLGGLVLEVPSSPFLEKNRENASDVVVLDGSLHTDFISNKKGWEINFGKLTAAQYIALKAVYDNQFTTLTYPTFVVPVMEINTPVRMYINDKDVKGYGDWVSNVTITLLEQ